MSEIVEDPEFKAPEIHRKDGVIQIYDLTKGDIFAAGVILLKMAIGKYFGDPQEKEHGVYEFLKSQNIKMIWSKIKAQTASGLKLSESLKDLVEKMLEFDPKARISLEEVLHHPWMQR